MIDQQDQLIDIYDMWYQPFWLQPWFFTVWVTVVVCLLVVAGYFLYKKYMQQKVPVDCADQAYQALNVFKEFHIVTKQDSKDCYFSLSSIIKQYLGCRYHTKFLRLTDEEIMHQVTEYITDENVQLLRQILQSMVFVKFEHEIAMTHKLEKDIALIEDFIKNTTPQADTKEN